MGEYSKTRGEINVVALILSLVYILALDVEVGSGDGDKYV